VTGVRLSGYLDGAVAEAEQDGMFGAKPVLDMRQVRCRGRRRRRGSAWIRAGFRI